MAKYTAEDFANAQFAEHEDGGLATRSGSEWYPWHCGGTSCSNDELMARYGWVPVPAKPSITESDYKFYENESGEGNMSVAGLLRRLGIEIIPDPEPTNTEKLAALAKLWLVDDTGYNDFTDFLDANGVKAGN